MVRGKIRSKPQIKNYDGLTEFHDAQSGQKCFIVGAGPSLYGLDISGIHKSVVISVNASCILMPWDKPEQWERRFWLSNDSLCIQMSYFTPKVLNAHCHRIVRNSWSKHFSVFDGVKYNVFSPRKSQSVPLTFEENRLCYTSSVPSAIDFAILMKCNPVYLVGVDHKMVDGKSHFWQFLPKQQQIYRTKKRLSYRPGFQSQEQVFDKNMSVFAALKEYGNRLGSQIYNCSPISTVDAFPFMSLTDAINA